MSEVAIDFLTSRGDVGLESEHSDLVPARAGRRAEAVVA